MANSLAELLQSGRFAITTELNPPKGTNVAPMLERAESLRGAVDAFNLTDSHTARMSMSPIAAARLLLDRGLEPILQMTCRDRNRIALQADTLAAAALGVSNIVTMTGDHPGGGDHPDAKPVFDIDSTALLRTLAELRDGRDMSGADLRGSPDLFVGAVVNPGADDLDREIGRMQEKISAGAAFFQTQAVYDAGDFDRFMRRVEGYGVPIIAGCIMLKSGNMARNFNANVPGISVPDAIIDRMDSAAESANARRIESADITAEIIRDIRPMCQGAHIMAIGWEALIPSVIENSHR
ncbi:MAG: 5,10-methylenetetrahydrofolate reductase [Chloroflexi bacterium]|nr:5,10-methylenetetrahydrofolate reductase [Chloroflexota bacterium]